MLDSLQKLSIPVIAIGVIFIGIEFLPVSRQARSWNKCLRATVDFLEMLPQLKNKSHNAREAMGVTICNGAVHQVPILKDAKD